jgi:hypothetical protein
MHNRPIWYGRDGQPIDATTANRLLGDMDYSRVALTRIASSSDSGIEYVISTVWLGCNYNWDDGPPIIFETMVFGGSKGQDQACYRWSTEQGAQAGHAEVVATVAATVPDEQVRDLTGWPVSLIKQDRA